MGSNLRPAVVLLALFTLLTGILYPLAVTVAAQTLLPHEANGSRIEQGDALLGSTLIGQPFTNAKYFWGRPSATAPSAYNASASSGSNLGPTNPALVTAVNERVSVLKQASPDVRAWPVPVDLVTASGSGLDPHISPAAALYQAGRVAQARGLEPERVRSLVQAHIEPRTWGLLGEPRVNVLVLNLALDR